MSHYDRTRTVTTALLVPLLLAGCASVPKLGAAPALRPAETFETAQSLSGPAALWPDRSWWAAYGDAQLTGLMDEALAASPSLEAAAARVRAAQALVRQTPGGPDLSASLEGSAALTKQSENMGIPPEFVPSGVLSTGRAALNVGLDLDLWGRNRAALAAATSEAEAAQVDAEASRLILTTALGQAYVDFARLFAARDVAAEALRVRQDSLALVRQRVGAGLNAGGELSQASSAERAARESLQDLDEQIGLARNAIAALLGAGPDRGIALVRPQVTALHPVGIPANLALDLVGRRPDIVSARLRAEAAASRIKVARADFYPNVNLSGVIGLQALGLGKLIDTGSTFGDAGPAISLPLFNQGTLGGRYEAARARYDEAVAGYNDTLTTAIREVADAVTSQRALAGRLAEARAALADAEQAYAAARSRFQAGLITRIELLSAEDDLLPRRRTVAELEARALSLDVAMVRALGGGFGRS
ncbi:efflux transporter outer membrane subunit [Allosphingosinicella deserti]|uniref:Multidrug transporter n=1 Tax=Allosphingosinicella deserti TaxID=2116704 RepID=A0A2P7QYQ8_9SPHN|nr:efflux transporter outer membrane subunit [Sphingomonas deserti]PSJ43096.1 multidrug transporter [Sphingomonas deserti]